MEQNLESVFSFGLSFQEIRNKLRPVCSCSTVRSSSAGSHPASCPVGSLYLAWNDHAARIYKERLARVPVRMPRLRDLEAFED